MVPQALVTRRTVLRLAPLAAAAVLGLTLAGCGVDSRMARAEVGRRPVDDREVPAVVRAASAFSVDLLAQAQGPDNLVCSPFSVLVTLAMLRNGATGRTAREMDRTLHLPPLERLNAGLNAVTRSLDERSGTRRRPDGSTAKVSLSVANTVWGQTGLAWQPAFLTALARDYGTGVRQQDFAGDHEQARRAVNDWVADATDDRITDMVPPGVFTPLTRLVLANALHLKAPWETPLQDAGSQPFSNARGAVPAPMLAGVLPAAGSVGPGWRAARLLLVGGELAMTVVLPDRSVPDLIRNLDGDGLVRLLATDPDRDVALTMPAFRFRSVLTLTELLQSMGMRRVFSLSAELGGLTSQEQLHLAHVLHQGWVEVTKDGVEAAAATVAVLEAVSATSVPDFTVVLDRPFLFCLHDVALGLPLLVGVLNDPDHSDGPAPR
jgi:serpin B